jgi:hypothetical protein
MNDFAAVLYNAAILPFDPVVRHLFSPTKDYSMVEMMAMLPNSHNVAKQYLFADEFEVIES